MRFLIAVLFAALLTSGCGQDRERAAKEAAKRAEDAAAIETLGTAAILSRNLPLAACLEEQTTDVEATASQCPTFILLALDFMIQECSAAGGTLKPAEEAEAWVLDVDGDGKTEKLVDLTRNYICYGAPSVSSCGSLGCPYFLYQQRGEAWVELGAVNADDAPSIEVLEGPAGSPAPLRGGCQGARPCSEITHYEWKGDAYDRAWIEFRNYIVDVVPGGLWTLKADAAVINAPNKKGQAIDEYPAGTAMVVLGKARDSDYQFVSPCNACRRGFVETAALSK